MCRPTENHPSRGRTAVEVYTDSATGNPVIEAARFERRIDVTRSTKEIAEDIRLAVPFLKT
jgi:hypothetical protein